MTHPRSSGCRRLATLLLAGVAVGCAEPEPQTVAEPGMDIHGIAVAGIETEKPEWERSARWARRSLSHKLRSLGAFEAVLDPPPATVADGVVVVRGTVEEHETLSGLGALGIGHGSAEMRVRFRIEDGEGRLLATFDAAAEGDSQDVMPARAMAEDVGADAARAASAWVRQQRHLLATAEERRVIPAAGPEAPAGANETPARAGP